jgi:hypothetical protein
MIPWSSVLVSSGVLWSLMKASRLTERTWDYLTGSKTSPEMQELLKQKRALEMMEFQLIALSRQLNNQRQEPETETEDYMVL